MNTINNFLSKLNTLIPHDKLLHMIYGLFLFLIITIVTLMINKHTVFGSLIFSVGLVTIIAMFKEFYDYLDKKHHTADIYDFIATISLPIVFVLFYYYVQMFK